MIYAQSKTRKFLFICNDHIGQAMAGPGIRYWEMAHALEQKGHKSVILSRHVEKGFFGGGLTFTGRAALVHLVTWISWSDFVILPGSPFAIIISILLRKRIIFDQYDPVIFEFFEHEPSTVAGKMRKWAMLLLWKIRQRLILRFGHGFLVANEKQKDFLIGQLALMENGHKLDSVAVLPFGLPDKEPQKKRSVLRGTKIKETDFLLIWGGGIWGWFDPFTLLRALSKIRSHRDDIKVYFPGIKPPNPDSRKLAIADSFLSEARSLGLLDTVVFVNREWTPYEDRADYLLEADAGISLHRDSMEMRFAFRTRILDYVWAGLPIISSTGDSWADLVEKRGLGLTVPPEAVDALVSAILTLAQDDALRQRCRKQVRLIANEYGWNKLVDRLSQFSDDKLHGPTSSN
jgi:glycosyltransferase involved in cell wall biosynthesis